MDSGREEGQKSKAEKYESVLIVVTQPMSPDIKCAIWRSQECGQWLNILPQYHNNTFLGEQEFCDNLLLRYCCTPADLPKHCESCRKNFILIRALECKPGGLIIVQHNKIQYELVQVGSQANTKSAISNEPYVNTSQGGRQVDAGEPDSPDTPSTLVQGADEELCSNAQEAEKNKKYHFLCQENRKNFSPFVVMVDGVIGREAKMVLKQIAQALAKKWSCPHLQAQNYVNMMIRVAIVRATHRCLRGFQVPSKFVNPDFLPFEDEARLHLMN
eukprot:453081-Ditylum_brightwellii.AAC.1